MKTKANIELLALRARTTGPGFLGLALLVAALSLAALTVRVAPAQAATFTVNTTDGVNDGGCTASHCSLNEAILAANRFSDTDTITFNIPGPAPHTIPLAGWLRRLFFPVIIDGTTQPGYAGKPIIELDGTLGGAPNPGLAFFGGSSTVRGLVINRVPGSGIHLHRGAAGGNYVIEDNYIGTDLTGTVDIGNGGDGIAVFPGTDAQPNGENTIARNVISGNGGNGITISNEDENVIQGNYIGTNASGTAALGNVQWGIRIVASRDNVVAENVISANGLETRRSGIVIHGAVPTALTGNVIQGNYIGTNASGTAALGNGGNGIETCGNQTTIGGTAPGTRNVISGNSWNGVYVGCGSTGSVVQGNLIGTAADGTTALGNGLAAPFNRDAGIQTYAGDTTIGGTAPGAANTIAHSTGPGVHITGAGGSRFAPPFTRNGILSNSIFSNGELGIDLYSGGVTPNDPGDADEAPNRLQNYPVLTSASGNTIAGTLNSIASTSFRLEFFANREADPSGHGEGERFIGSTQVTTDGSGNASFGFTSPTSFGGEYVAATATDPANNTSEFSRMLFVPGQTPSPTLTLSPPTATNDTGEEHCVTATARDGSGNAMAGATVRFSVSGANSGSGSAQTDANGVAEFCYTGTNAGLDTIAAYVDGDGDSTQDEGEPADEAFKTYVATVPPEAPPYLLLIDESSIDNGNAPNLFPATDVNDELASLALRTPLAAFDGENVGRTYTLHTGEVGDEGWFAPKTIPQAWAEAGPTVDGIRNFVGNPREPYPHNVGPGLGTADANGDRESLLDKVPDVTPLRATALGMLAAEGATFCAVVYDGDLSIDYDPLSGSLKGANLGTVAFRMLSSSPLLDHSTGSLPAVEVEVLDAGTVCEQELQLFVGVPEPESSSEPYDTGRPADG